MSNLYFVISDYFATGEGSTRALLITRAYPSAEDYVEPVDYNNIKYKNTGEERALRAMADWIGPYFAQGAELISKEEFLEKYERHCAPYIKNIVEKNDAGAFTYFTYLHLNFS